MSIFAEAVDAKKPRSPQSVAMARLLAGLFVVMATAQLFEFDGFLALLSTFNLPVSGLSAYLLGGVIVVGEVFSLPFLLRLPLSRAFRWVSMVCTWLVSGLWVALSLWLMVAQPAVESTGMLGTIQLIPGWWAVLVSLAFGILAAWASWGMWPGRRRR